jgi:hypothetical protein
MAVMSPAQMDRFAMLRWIGCCISFFLVSEEDWRSLGPIDKLK